MICSDYGYMNGTEGELAEATGAADPENLPILVMRDRKTKTLAASYVPAKGQDPYAVKFMGGVFKRLGYRKIVNKSDGERALVALKAKAAEFAGIDAVPRESPVGDSKANGVAESAVKEVKAAMRAMKSSLEAKLGMPLEENDPVVAWMPMAAADLISERRQREEELEEVGKDPSWSLERDCFSEKRSPEMR